MPSRAFDAAFKLEVTTRDGSDGTTVTCRDCDAQWFVRGVVDTGTRNSLLNHAARHDAKDLGALPPAKMVRVR